MDEECLGLRTQKFRKGDHVAVASRAAVSKIHVYAPVPRDFDKSSCFDKVGTVESVIPTGDVAVTFARDIRCAIHPEALLKIPNLSPGALVKLVDDIRGDGNLKLQKEISNEKTKICGGICIVLRPDDDFPDTIRVRIWDCEKKLTRFHLDLVATPLDKELS